MNFEQKVPAHEPVESQVRTLTLTKGRHTFVFRYDDLVGLDMALRKLARNPFGGLDWFDMARLMFHARLCH